MADRAMRWRRRMAGVEMNGRRGRCIVVIRRGQSDARDLLQIALEQMGHHVEPAPTGALPSSGR